MKNSGDNVLRGISAAENEESLVAEYVGSRDLSPHTIKAIRCDLRKFALWFVSANKEPFRTSRITTRDVTDLREFLRREKGQAVSTINRCLVNIRGYLKHLVDKGHLDGNPAEAVKELRRQKLAPKGLERSQVRKLLREIELRGDVRSDSMFSLMLYTGCRVSDLVNLELQDLLMAERSGHVVFRFGKGGKQRTCPLVLACRRALQAYLETRPPVDTPRVFIGERGELTARGIRAVCAKYSTYVGFRIHPHLLRHTFAHQFLKDTGNDLVALAQILGHSNLNTTSIYTQRTAEQLASTVDQVVY